jgi:hypothetical protein
MYPPGIRAGVKNTGTRIASNSAMTLLSSAGRILFRPLRSLLHHDRVEDEEDGGSAPVRDDCELDSNSLLRDRPQAHHAVIGCVRERDVVARDSRDIRTVEILRDVVGSWLEQIRDLEPLEHPDSRWHPDDLRDALLGAQVSLQAELDRLHRQPLLVLL